MTYNTSMTKRATLTRFAWLSLAAALLTMVLKAAAYWLTGSVGLLSDGLESLVNLAGALIALIMLTIAARPADEDHAYGHTKAEYFSSGAEGMLIILAAISIGITAVPRLINPQPLDQIGLGMAISVLAALVNLVVALILQGVGKQYNSVTLQANARHLLTDVWTTGGVLLGITAVTLTGWQRLDPLVALLVAANIVWSGGRIIRQSALGLMDTALPSSEQALLTQVLQTYMQLGVQFHAVRTRQSGTRRFVSFHVLVPGKWTVQDGHDLLEQIEADVRRALPNATVFTHLEPLNDPISWNDLSLDRAEIEDEWELGN
jgi:cation diffusion facilitator family transporter